MSRRTNGGSSLPRLFTIGAVAAMMVVSAAGAAVRPVARFHTPFAPGFLAIDNGNVWVAAHRSGGLYELDPRTNRVVRVIQTQDDVYDLTVQDGFLLVFQSGGPSFTIVDPRTGRFVRHRLVLPEHWGGSAWKLTPAGITRLDPTSHVVLKRFPIRSGEGPVIEAAGSLWWPSDAWVTRIDLATNTETVIPLPGGETAPGPDQGYAIVSNLVATPGKVWIGNPAGVYWIDEATDRATVVPGTRIGNLDQWGNIILAAGAGSVFARTGPSTISRIDPTRLRVVGKYPGAGGGGAVAVGFGSLWVTNFGTDTTWRIPLG